MAHLMETSTLILLFTSFLTSILSGLIGMGGGILLLTVMAQYFPPADLIPLHGLLQLGSNASRVVYGYRSFDRCITLQYAVGAIAGAALGSLWVLKIPEHAYQIVLGLFILAITFIPLPQSRRRLALKWPLVGAATTFLGVYVGATGPLIAPFFLSESLRKEALVTTKAAAQVFTHLFKVLAFFALGFQIGTYLPLLVGMLALSFAGNYVGTRFLHRIPDRWFTWLFQGLIALLAGRMILEGLGA